MGLYAWLLILPFADDYGRLKQAIREKESQTNLHLSWGAKAMLIVPIVEAQQASDSIDWEETQESLDLVFNSLREQEKDDLPSNEEAIARSQRSSISIIKAFWKNFCNIPPFCART